MQKTAPIGIFDSGIGGTSIWREIHSLLPNESTRYLADSHNAPYGSRSREEIIALSEKNTRILLDMGCKIIVVACNTATTNAVGYLRSQFNIPFIGIEPAIKPASLQTQTNSIGILATRGTLSSELFHNTSKVFTHNIKLTEVIGEGIVQIIEAGKIHSNEMEELLKKYIQPMLENDIDHLVLGCTHYPYLIPQLRRLLPKKVKIVDSGVAVALQTKNILKMHELLNPVGKNVSWKFYSNGKLDVLKNILSDLKEDLSIEFKDF